jgi:cardiolipin synthase
MHHRSLIILPDDTMQPLQDAIDRAHRSIRIKMFIFSDNNLIDAIIAAHVRGVQVRVLLNPARRNGVEENEEAREQLERAGVEVRDSNPAFGMTHEKSMVVDEEKAFIQSLNWDRKHHHDIRDYGLVTSFPSEVNEVIKCFEADWDQKSFDSSESALLVWCPGNGRARIAHLIDRAEHPSMYRTTVTRTWRSLSD